MNDRQPSQEQRLRQDSGERHPRHDRDGSREQNLRRDRERRPRRSRWVWAGAGLVVAVLAYAVPAIAMSGRVPPDTRVAGVDIGGLSPEQARDRLEQEFGRRLSLPMTLVAAGRTKRVTPAELGLAVDTGASVQAALDGASTPAGILRSLFSSRRLEPKVTVDARSLAALGFDAGPREGGVRYHGLEPRAVLPKPGRAVDRDAAARAVRDAFAKGRWTVELAVRETPPSVPASEVRRVAASTARTAVAAPLTVVGDGKRATLSRAQLAAGLRFVPDGAGGLRPSYDATQVAASLDRALMDDAQRPRDASFKIVGGKPRVVPARTGRGVDVKALGTAVAEAVAAGRRSVDVPVTETRPRVTTEAAGAMGIKEQVGSFTTRYPCCVPRVTNIHRIADTVNGYVVKPGETFSLNGVVGERDKARGFVEAPMILNNRFVNDVGGGVSQFATTMFNAVFFGGFQDVQHTPHQYYISRYPAGRESTVSFPQPDFRWRNDSPYGVLIRTSYTATSVTVQFWSTKRYDIESQSSPRYQVKPIPTITESGPECIPMGGAEGFAIDVWRVFKKDGKVVRKQRFHTVYDPEPRLTCR